MLLAAYSDDPQFGLLAAAHAALTCLWIGLATPAQCSATLGAQMVGPDGRALQPLTAVAAPDLHVATLDRDDPAFTIALTKARPWRRLARQRRTYRSRYVLDVRSADRLTW